MSKGRLEVERQKRDKYLQRRVQETLCLSPPPQPDRCAHGACPVSSEQLKAQSRAYQEKLRLNRILQVRAQEMLFASKRIAEFRDRKTKDSKMLINHLKEVWSKDQRRRIASLEEEYANACQSIGLSHDAAQLVERNKAAKEELMARQAEEGRYWDTLRFEEAMQKEREQKERRERGESASTLRRKIVESVSSIERSFARRYNCGAKPKPPQEKHAYGCSQSVNPPVTHDTTREKVYTKLAGTPIDFKDTYLHSRFDILQDRTNRPSSAVVNCPEQEEIDAWRAADAQRESNRCERARQIELERLYNERKLERGSAAAAKLLNDQRIALLEQEVEEAFKEEEREQERLHAVTGICKRATMAGQQRRPVYSKHKISNPLSCPDSVSPENDSQERPPENHPANRKPKSFQDQIELKIDVQGKKIQLADLVSSQAHQQKEVEFSGSTRKSADGRLMHSEGRAEGLILEPGVSKSLPHYPVQTKRKGISPIRASCEEGNVMKQPRVKSPNKCLMLKQNSDGSDRTGKRLFHVGEEAAGPGSRWRLREKERDNESWIKDLTEKASPGKTRYHMELVREAAEVEKEVEEFYKGNKRRPVPQKSPSQRSVENGESQRSQRVENGETQRSQRDASRPPFIASGTIGYKKVLTVPLISRTASRPSSEPALEKTSSVRESLKPLTKGLGLENLDADEHVSPIRRPSSGINNNGMETSRSWSHPLRPHSGPPKGLKTVISAKCAEHSSDDSGLLNDSAPKRDPASPRNRNKDIRSRFETWNASAGNGNGSELIFEIGKPKVENARKGNGPEKRVQEPKLRHKAVWKSYMDEKKQNSRKNLETPLTAKSEPSSPPARMERVISSRAKRQTDLQEVGFEQPLVIPNCHTPAASVKSLPISRPRNGRDKSVPRSWKYSQESSKRIEVEASENTSTKTKSLSNRFHSPVTQVPRDTSPLRKNRKVVTLHPSGNLAEKAGSARKDGSPSNVADTLLSAWKTGKFQEDYVKAMKRAKEITSGSSSSGISKIFSDRKSSKPWLSRSPFKRSADGEVNEVSLNQRSVSANPRADYKSPMNRSRNKPSSLSSPERMVDDLGQSHRSGSAHPKARNRSPMSRSHATTMLSPKRTNWTSQTLWGPESSKSSPVKIKAGKGETSKDPWEGQSLDFVLGSLAEQVRELDERLRSATVSSPALSSSSSISREVYGNREKHIPDQPNFRLPDKLNYEDRGSPSSTSATSSPERICVQAARYISRGYTGSQKDSIYKAAKRPASTTYMDELKALLKEISSDNPSPPRRNHVCSNGRRVESESKRHKVQDTARKTESLHKNGITRPKVKAELESDFTSSTSANTSRPCSVASQRDPRETRQRMSPVVGNCRASSRGRVIRDAFHANGNGKLQGERERASDRVYERRSVPQENGFREDNGIRRVMEKRLVQSGRTQPQVAESVYRDVQERPVQIQERFEKRTVEVRSCAPQHVLHNGHTVVREQLVKEVVENGLPSPEMNGHNSLRRISDREQKEANGEVTPVKQKRNDEAPQRTLSNGKFASNGNGERGSAQPRGPAAHPTSNGHKMTTDKRPTQQMQDQTSDYALSNGGEKLKSRQLESPLWGEGSPHCSASWRKGAVNRDEIEDRMLLSGSVDFSPWNTEKLPDIGTPQTARENRTTRSKSPPIAEDTTGNGSLSPKFQRAKLPPKLNKPFGQRPVRKDAQPNGEALFHPNPAPVRETTPKSQARPNLKKPKPVPRGIDTIWSLNDQDVALKPSAAQNAVPPTLRKSTPAKRRTASVPRARLMKEQTSSSEEVPDSTSKSSHDDNYLPVIMAKDPESRQRVIERRKKALQLDMEHRQRLARNSRPTSARSSA